VQLLQNTSDIQKSATASQVVAENDNRTVFLSTDNAILTLVNSLHYDHKLSDQVAVMSMIDNSRVAHFV